MCVNVLVKVRIFEVTACLESVSVGEGWEWKDAVTNIDVSEKGIV